ncbi:MAG: hypothetical protein GY769_17665 [bacterium]|nr:hypothetical protein [bacterium]
MKRKVHMVGDPDRPEMYRDRPLCRMEGATWGYRPDLEENYQTTDRDTEVTCARCTKALAQRYPWRILR